MIDVIWHHHCNHPIRELLGLIVYRPTWQLRWRFGKCQMNLRKRAIIQLVEHIVTGRILSYGLKPPSIQCVRRGNLL